MELEAIMQESIELHEEQFFNNKFFYSYSSLNKLMWNPQAFYQMYVLGIREEKLDAHLVQGKLIHALLLEPEKFDEQFIVSPSNLPTGNLRTVVDRVFRHHVEVSSQGDPREKLEEFEGAILDVMRDMNYHQSLKTDQQRLDKILTADAFNYWAFLKMKAGKTLIDQETLDFCKTAAELVKSNKDIMDLIGANTTEFDNKVVYNEMYMEIPLDSKSYGFKGIIDNIVLDHDNKVIYINDIKTTSKDLKDFQDSIEYYGYWLQAVVYLIMITKVYGYLIDQGFQLKFHFIVIDRAFQTYAFPVSETTLTSWLERFKKLMEKVEWHYENKSYDLPYEFANGLVVL